ncbi:uncharacterized protein BXZ73DRAFT_45507 [Epithele typhae]|uniref:uncharacterized protein n=1 Tax=Epithele typhae TaxID=378194 RepID=UPI0020080A1E|nr:uncharacterized protein BXZ73DRAFT_45507 [Epithele typhae]KAH9935140.1 hypothetical protein BXZ73DRAFT_45507 [Epithele typhae]
MPLVHAQSYGSFSGLLDTPSAMPRRPSSPEHKPLPRIPQPSDGISLSAMEDEDDATLLASDSVRSSATAVMSKRQYALFELVSSERAYAHDLSLIRDIHIPLALGQPIPPATPATPPGSASSSRAVSAASEPPPMTPEDVRIVFNNIGQIADFAIDLADALQTALGQVGEAALEHGRDSMGSINGGLTDDELGKVMIASVAEMEALYRPYITKHSNALEHLKNLPQTPALTSYLAHTTALASSMSHAWDLPSLLIKPVQRLLKYPLLLAAIIDETPDTHPDKSWLRAARESLEEVARGVNEGRRRREVVREVLAGGHGIVATPRINDVKGKKKTLGIGPSVSLGRMKTIRAAALTAKEGPEANVEAEEVRALGDQLKRHDAFVKRFAEDALAWVDAAGDMTAALDEWAHVFGNVIWMDDDGGGSEAFEAFRDLIADHLLPICQQTRTEITEQLIPMLDALVKTTVAPMRLLEAMKTLEPVHYGLLNVDVTKSRPPPQLLDMSQSYVALREQLAAELPQYLRLFDAAASGCTLRFATIQSRYFYRVRERWSELWDALKVDEEANLGAPETLRVWWSRFAEVEVQLKALRIIQPPPSRRAPAEKLRLRQPANGTPRGRGDGDVASVAVVSTMLAALEPLSIPTPSPTRGAFAAGTSPQSGKTRSVHSVEGEGRTVMSPRKSQESIHSKRSGKSHRTPSRGTSLGGMHDEGFHGLPGLTALAPTREKDRGKQREQRPNREQDPHDEATYSRSRSMPLATAPPMGKVSSSPSLGKFLDVPDEESSNSSNPSIISVVLDDRDGRGRPARKPSFRRRLTDSFRANPLSSDAAAQVQAQTPPSTRQRRSPSLPNPSPSPTKASFASSASTFVPSPSYPRGLSRRRTSGQMPSLYECRVIHRCEPPPGVSYRDLPFFTLRVDDVYEILEEAGHPSTHRDLPLYVDDGEDCLLLARSARGDVGWVLASFLLPVD